MRDEETTGDPEKPHPGAVEKPLDADGSYRMGYVDGASACLRSVRAGRSVHQVEEWLRELGAKEWNGKEPPRRL